MLRSVFVGRIRSWGSGQQSPIHCRFRSWVAIAPPDMFQWARDFQGSDETYSVNHRSHQRSSSHSGSPANSPTSVLEPQPSGPIHGKVPPFEVRLRKPPASKRCGDYIPEEMSGKQLHTHHIAPPSRCCFQCTAAAAEAVVASASWSKGLESSYALPEGYADDYCAQASSRGSRQRFLRPYPVASANSTVGPFGTGILDLAGRSSSLVDHLM